MRDQDIILGMAGLRRDMFNTLNEVIGMLELMLGSEIMKNKAMRNVMVAKGLFTAEEVDAEVEKIRQEAVDKSKAPAVVPATEMPTGPLPDNNLTPVENNLPNTEVKS